MCVFLPSPSHPKQQQRSGSRDLPPVLATAAAAAEGLHVDSQQHVARRLRRSIGQRWSLGTTPDGGTRSGDIGPNNTKGGWRWRIYFLHEKKRPGNGAIFVKTCCAIDMAGLFKQQIQRKSPVFGGRKNSFPKKMDNKKHPKPKVFSLQLLKVLHMSNEKKT